MTPPPRAFDRGTATPDEKAALWESLCSILLVMHETGMLGPAVRVTGAPPVPFGQGARGPSVGVWQMVLGVKKDDVFGPETLRATRAWAKAAGFGDAKVVTPAMWATAVGVTLKFEPGAVLMPGGARVTLGELEAHATTALSVAALTPPGPEHPEGAPA